MSAPMDEIEHPLSKSVSRSLGPGLLVLLVMSIVAAHWCLAQDADRWTREQERSTPSQITSRPSNLTMFWQGRRPGFLSPPVLPMFLRQIRELREQAERVGMDIETLLPETTDLARASGCRTLHDEPCASLIHRLETIEQQLDRAARERR